MNAALVMSDLLPILAHIKTYWPGTLFFCFKDELKETYVSVWNKMSITVVSDCCCNLYLVCFFHCPRKPAK